MKGSRLIPVGKIVRLHGVRGAVKILPYGESLNLLGPGATLHVIESPAGGSTRPLTVAGLAVQARSCIVKFHEIGDPDQAELLKNQEVFLPESQLAPLQEDEYYHYQLIGLAVETSSGDPVGTLTGILETGGHDVYVIDRDGREVLIPAVASVICRIDLEHRRMVIDPPAGLIEESL
jgi:16S rRNA processing protein RimM